MPTPIKEAVSAEKIADDIKVVGDQIREMKASGAKSTVGVLVNELKALKARYQEVTGEAYDSGMASPEGKPKMPASPEDPNKQEGPSKNEQKKAAKAAAKDAKRAAYKEGGVPGTPGKAGVAAADVVTPVEDLEGMNYGDLLVGCLCRRLNLSKHGMPLFDATTIAKALCGKNSPAAAADSTVGALLGSAEQEKADVVGWMAMAMKVDDPDYAGSFGPAVNMQLNGVFADGPTCPMWLVGDAVTLADIAIYYAGVKSPGAFDNFTAGAQAWKSAIAAWAKNPPCPIRTNAAAAAASAEGGEKENSGEANVGPVSQPAKRLARMNGDVVTPPPAPPSSAAAGAGGEGSGAVPPPAPEGMSDEARAAKQAAAKAAKEAKKAAKKEKEPAAPAAADEGNDCCKLHICVGKIVKAWEHPESDKLWCESIECGEASGPRTICSGLRAFYATADDVAGRMVLVAANLKPRKMAGVESNGMVFCASNEEHTIVKFVEVPAGAKPGDRVSFEGLPVEPPATAKQVEKKKIAEQVIFGKQLKTIAGGVCTFNGANPMVVEGLGPCTAPVEAGYTVA